MDAFGASEETRAITAEVDRFATRVIEPRVGPLSPAALAAVLDEARALALLPGDEGAALWDGGEEAALCSVLVLARLGRASPAVALAAHQASAARRVARALGLDAPGDGVLVPHGRFGIGRDALARHLAGVPPSEGDRLLLADVYAAAEPRLSTAPASFSWVLRPVVDAEGALQWTLSARAALEIVEHRRAHGFDELSTFSFRPARGAPEPVVTALGPAASRERLADALAVAALGMVAVALGAAERGHAIALGHAATRWQGGKLIGEHAAVKLLLASSRRAIDAVSAQLAEAARRPPGIDTLARTLAMRAEAHPLLARAANDALQVLGGSGYMAEAGVEKVLRDVNHLRVSGASPPELSLFVAEWERLHA